MAAPDYHEQFGAVEVDLRSDIEFSRQQMGGQIRYVLHDPISFQSHVLSLFEYRVASGIVGSRSLSANFDKLVERGITKPTDRDSFYEFVMALHAKNLLLLPIHNAESLLDRRARKLAAKRRSWYTCVSYFKLPLFNPDRFLTRTVRYVSWLYSRIGLGMWAVLMFLASWKCLGRFSELFEQSASMLDISNLPVIWIALVVLKVIHEFGHAYACKRFGGVVPEMGAAFIVLTPCAYVDAGASWKFPSRWQRVAVSLAGMYLESMVAAIFALVWASTSPGLLHDMALNVVVLAGVVTVLFNINPLMRFDGYFVLSDILGVINLRKRSDDLLKYAARRVALGLPRPATNYTFGERMVYWLYAPCSFLYKISLAIGITTMMVITWSGAGLLFGLLFGWILIVAPIKRTITYLLRSEEALTVKARARWVAAGVFAALPLCVVYVPISFSVVAPGVLEPEERQSIRAPVSGVVITDVGRHGRRIGAGTELCQLQNSELDMRQLVIDGKLSAERARLAAEEVRDLTLASIHRARLSYLQARQAEVTKQVESMQVLAKTGGTLVSSEPRGWLGSFVSKGQELYQVHSGGNLVRVILTDDDVLRAKLEVGSTAEIRWTSDPTHATRGIVREIRRSASRKNIPLEITMLGGGEVYANRVEGESDIQADRPYLHVFIEPAETPPVAVRTGLTAKVRMVASMETFGGWVAKWVLSICNAWRMS